MIRARIIARGRVQGVFYRASVREIALGMGISGYVMNLQDGTVLIVCECKTREELDSFISRLKMREMHGPHVDSIECTVEKAEKKEFTGFSIKY